MKKTLLLGALLALAQFSFGQHNLHLTFDVSLPTFCISSPDNEYHFESAQWAPGNLSADIPVAAGTYNMAFFFHGDKIVFKENVVINSNTELSVLAADANNEILLRPTDELGNVLTPPWLSVNIVFPGMTRDHQMSYTPFSERMYLSDFSEAIKVVFGVVNANYTTNKIHAIELPLLNGVSASQTLANNPASLFMQKVAFNLNTSTANRFLSVDFHLRHHQNTDLVWGGSINRSPNLAPSEVWNGSIYMSPNLGQEFGWAVSVKQTDGAHKQYYRTEFFQEYQGKGINSARYPPTAEIYQADQGETMTFGKGALHPFTGYSSWYIDYVGQLREKRPDDTRTATYDIYNRDGAHIGSGLYYNLTQEVFPIGYNKVVIKNNQYKIGNIQGECTLTNGWDMTQLDPDVPKITSLQIRNHLGQPAETVTYGAANSISFSIDDVALKTIKAYVKKNGSTVWQMVNFDLVVQLPGLYPPVGNVYQADLSAVRIGNSAVDLKITADDQTGNSTEWILAPAYIVEGAGKAPMITGQKAVATRMGKEKTITLTDILVTDPDSAYPDEFTLQVSSGSNYTVSGNKITPASTFWGPLSVPVQVNDGSSNSNVFNLRVDVGTPLELDSLALVDLYNSAGGISWTDKTNWLTGRISSWKGVTLFGSRVTTISLGNNNLTGTADFTRGLEELKTLSLTQNKLTRLNISSLKAITALQAGYNPLTTLISRKDANYYSKLGTVTVGPSKLSSVDISNMPALTNVYVAYDYGTNTKSTLFTQLITNPAVDYYPLLTSLHAGYTSISSINTSGMKNLKTLYVQSTNLSALDVSNNTALTHLWAFSTDLTALDISKNTLLANLQVNNSKLAALDISKNPGLQSVVANHNNIKTFTTNSTLNYYPALVDLRINNNEMNKVDISGMPALVTVNIGLFSGTTNAVNPNLTQVITTPTPGYYYKLVTFNLYSTAVQSIDLAGMSNLENLNIYTNKLSSLNVKVLPKLKFLSAQQNQLTSVDISENAQLTNVGLANNLLTQLITNTAPDYYRFLTDLSVHFNNLGGINISNMPALKQVAAGSKPGGGKSSLSTVTTNTTPNYYSALKTLNVTNSSITQINLSGMSALTSLFLYSNSLASVDVTALTSLQTLRVDYNALSSLNVQNLPALRYVYADHNQLTSFSMNSTSLITLQLQYNMLTFNYLEPLMGKTSGLTYNPQTPIINTPYTQNFTGGTTISMNVSTGGNNNKYQWQKRNSTGGWANILGANSFSYSKSNAQPADAGVYRCAITNSMVTGLTLYRQEITITVSGLARLSTHKEDLSLQVEEETSLTESFDIYPVPAIDRLTVTVNGSHDAVDVALINASGIPVKTGSSNTNNVTLNVSDIASGIYLVKVKSAGRTAMRKVIIN